MSYVYYISLNPNECLIEKTSDHEGNKTREDIAEGRGMTLSEFKKYRTMWSSLRLRGHVHQPVSQR